MDYSLQPRNTTALDYDSWHLTQGYDCHGEIVGFRLMPKTMLVCDNQCLLLPNGLLLYSTKSPFEAIQKLVALHEYPLCHIEVGQIDFGNVGLRVHGRVVNPPESESYAVCAVRGEGRVIQKDNMIKTCDGLSIILANETHLPSSHIIATRRQPSSRSGPLCVMRGANGVLAVPSPA